MTSTAPVDEHASYTPWTPPAYDVTRAPAQSHKVLLSYNEDGQNYARSAKWAPDGLTALAHCENRTLHLLNPTGDIEESSSKLAYTAHSPILDYLWHPMATSTNPASYCYVASVREGPVKLLDGNDGRLRASYSIVDHRERHIAPHSLAFTAYADKLYCGFEDAVEIFDVNRPGHEGIRIHTTPTKKSKEGLRGIVSSLSFSPGSTMYAAATLTPATSLGNPNIAIFDDDSPIPLMYVGGIARGGAIQVKFNPMKPELLFATFRGPHSSLVYCWDIRASGDIPCKMLQYDDTGKPSNQRRNFDIDITGRWLTIGAQDGRVHIFDLNREEEDPVLSYKAHNDAVGSVAFNVVTPSLLSVSGSRHFDLREENSATSSEDEEEQTQRSKPYTKDNGIAIWDFGTKI